MKAVLLKLRRLGVQGVLRGALVGVTLGTVLCASSPATAWAAKTFILCERDPQYTAVLPTLRSSDPRKDPCSGTVTLQGMAYQCGKLSEVESATNDFLKGLRVEGEKECKRECAKRSTDSIQCTGIFTPPTKCGFSVPPREALRFGKEEVPCNPECRGQAFAYCSVYHASYLTVEPAMFRGKSPNCFCKVD